jgi:hypothetical protein
MGLKQYDEARQKVAAIQQRLDSTIREVRDNRAYSDSGRRGEMARAVLQAKKEADTLRDKFAAARDLRRESLQKSLFGDLSTASALEVANMRDADDRAERLETAGNAQSLLDRARSRGDGVLARAVARHAFNKGWSEVIDRYAENVGSITREMLDELGNITSGPNTAAAEAAVFRVRGPQELLGLDDAATLENYAANAEAGAL